MNKKKVNKAKAVSLARQYRLGRDLDDPDEADCVVVIRNGRAIGENYQRRPAEGTPYRDICVDINDNVFIALGHSSFDMADYWVPLA
jgi:hypothetical protein